MLDEWEAMAQRQRELDAVQHERERRTLVQLLNASAQPELALVVTGSEYRSDCVDNWDGGQYEITLGVPPEHIFKITDGHREHLERCLRVIVGEKHYRGLTVGVRLAEHQPGWDIDFAKQLWARLDAADVAAAAETRPALP
jgi:hypothetical protein